MTDTDRGEAHPDSPPSADSNPDSRPSDAGIRADPRSDIEQIVDARADAVARGEGGPEPDTMTATGVPSGPTGTGGVTKNQDDDQQ